MDRICSLRCLLLVSALLRWETSNCKIISPYCRFSRPDACTVVSSVLHGSSNIEEVHTSEMVSRSAGSSQPVLLKLEPRAMVPSLAVAEPVVWRPITYVLVGHFDDVTSLAAFC